MFGLFFDSLLGATLERRGRINNDAVNFLSTLAAALFAGPLLIAAFCRKYAPESALVRGAATPCS